MGFRTYFIISLILFSSLALSPVSAATVELPRQRDGERDSKIPFPPVIIDPICRRQDSCPPPTTATKP